MRRSVKLTPVTKKIAENMHVLRRKVDAPVPGNRRRQQIRWKESCKVNMESVGLKHAGFICGTKWNSRETFITITATPCDGKARVEE